MPSLGSKAGKRGLTGKNLYLLLAALAWSWKTYDLLLRVSQQGLENCQSRASSLGLTPILADWFSAALRDI